MSAYFLEKERGNREVVSFYLVLIQGQGLAWNLLVRKRACWGEIPHQGQEKSSALLDEVR